MKSTHYYCDFIKDGDSAYLSYRFATSDDDSWKISDGIVLHYDPKRVFFGFDDHIINLDRNRVIPKGVGRSQIYVRHPNADSTSIVDTLFIEVNNSGGILKVTEMVHDSTAGVHGV